MPVTDKVAGKTRDEMQPNHEQANKFVNKVIMLLLESSFPSNYFDSMLFSTACGRTKDDILRDTFEEMQLLKCIHVKGLKDNFQKEMCIFSFLSLSGQFGFLIVCVYHLIQICVRLD